MRATSNPTSRPNDLNSWNMSARRNSVVSWTWKTGLRAAGIETHGSLRIETFDAA